MDKTPTEGAYYTASGGTTTGAQTLRDVAARSVNAPTPTRSRAQLNREQIISTNVFFVLAILLFLFIVFWYKDLSTVGFYYVFSVNALLFVTVYCTWMNASKWFQVPAALIRRKTHANPL